MVDRRETEKDSAYVQRTSGIFGYLRECQCNPVPLAIYTPTINIAFSISKRPGFHLKHLYRKKPGGGEAKLHAGWPRRAAKSIDECANCQVRSCCDDHSLGFALLVGRFSATPLSQ